MVPESLVTGVELLCLDAGNTVIFLDHKRLAGSLEARGVSAAAPRLIEAEGNAKHAQENDCMVDVDWAEVGAPGAKAWGQMLGTMAHDVGVPVAALPELLVHVWRSHVALNYWSLVPPGLGAAVAGLRARGVRVAIVSNSEGQLESLFERLGLTDAFDLVVDSGVLGVAKPDPRIFEHTLAHFGVAPQRALHLGDSIATDVEGAEAAGIRVALIDPYGHSAGRRLDVPRVQGVVAVADAIVSRAG